MAVSIIHELKYYAPIAASKLYEQRHNFLTLLAIHGRAKTEYNTRTPRFMWRISKDDYTATATKTPKPTATHKSLNEKRAEPVTAAQATSPDMSKIPASFSAYFKH
jgi:hypothetical protein